MPPFDRQAVDLLVRTLFLRHAGAFDQAPPGQVRKRRVDRSVAGDEEVAERLFEMLLDLVTGEITLGEHTETKGFYIHIDRRLRDYIRAIYIT